LSSTGTITKVLTCERPGKLDKDIRWECCNCPNCPDISASRDSWVRRGRVLIAQHGIVVVLARH